MGSEDVDNMIRDLDLNGDGQIDESEFEHWWLTGRKGLSSAARKLLAYKIQTMQMLKST